MKKIIKYLVFSLLMLFSFSLNVNAASISDNWSIDGTISQSIHSDNNTVIFNGTGTINVLEDFKAFIVIESGSDILINMNGHTLETPSVLSTYSETKNSGILIHNKGKLKITGNGTFISSLYHYNPDNEIYSWGLVGHDLISNYENANLHLLNGTYTRSLKDNPKGNSAYQIRNLGSVIIESNVKINSGDVTRNSSLIGSGWQTLPEGDVKEASVIINGGEFIGGRRSVTTDLNAVTIVNGGTFVHDVRETFKSAGKTIINDGKFTSPAGVAVLATENDGTISVNGGIFSSDVSTYMNVDSESIKNEDGTYTVNFVYADYSKIDEIIEKVIEEGVDTYTKESIAALEKELEKVDWELGKSKQADVDKMVEAVTKAFNQLKKIENPKTGNGIVTYILSAIIMILGIGGCIIYRKKLFN